MVERGQQSRLALEARPPIRVGQHEARQDFEGDVAVERRVTGPIDTAHAARSEESRNLVGSEAIARDERMGPVCKYVRDRFEHASAQDAIDRWREDALMAGIGSQQGLDVGLQCPVITAPVTNERRAVFDAAGHRSIEDLFGPLPAPDRAHVDSWERPDVIRRWSHAFALLSSLATVDRETDV